MARRRRRSGLGDPVEVHRGRFLEDRQVATEAAKSTERHVAEGNCSLAFADLLDAHAAVSSMHEHADSLNEPGVESTYNSTWRTVKGARAVFAKSCVRKLKPKKPAQGRLF